MSILHPMLSPSELKRFELHGKLGEGADSEVFAATDTETGSPVVVKRPHPALVTRAQHNAVERRLANVIDLRQRLGEALPHVARMLARIERAAHDDYFGDRLGEEYSVVVEERAEGIPLVGSAIDGIKRQPIGAPQNLFAVHPVISHQQRGRFSIVRDLLEVAEAFQKAGVLILDLRPQNIYFSPGSATITVIDIGGVTEERAADGRNAPLDLHDFYLEIFKWYMPHSAPPSSYQGYRQPIGMETIPMFNQNLDTMIRLHSEAAEESWRFAALEILRKVRKRAYTSIQQFKHDFEAYLPLLEANYAALPEESTATRAWLEAKSLLTTEYWGKFRFNSADLAAYG